MALITRQGKGSRLTIEELDGNFTYLESLTGSLENRLDTLEVESGSIRSTFNSFTSSVDSAQIVLAGRLDTLEVESGSIRSTFNSFTSSVDSAQIILAGRLDTLEVESGSIRSTFNSFTSSNNTRLDTLENDTSLSESVAEIVTGIDVRILALEDQGVATAEVPGTMSTADKIKLDGIQAGAQVNITNNLSITGTISSFNSLIGTPSSEVIEYTVTVVTKTSNHRYFGTGSALGYHINGIESPFLTLLPGKTYRFLQDDASNDSHQLKFYLEADRTTQFNTNVTLNGTAGSVGAYSQIVVTDTTPIVLHYQCNHHGFMGNSAQFNSAAPVQSVNGLIGNVTIPSASVSESGLVTTVDQTFAGNKTFTNSVAADSLSASKSISLYTSLIGSPSSAVIEHTVTVVTKTSNHRYFGIGSSLGYHINGIESPFLTLLPGKTYRFLQDDVSNDSHQLKFYLQADRTTQFNTNVTFNGTAGSAGAYSQIVVTDSTPIVLHYQCNHHGFMGNSAQFSSNAIDTPYPINARNGITSTGQLSMKGYSETIFTLTDAATVTPVVSNGTIQNWTLGANRTLSTASINAGESLMLVISTGGVSRSITWSTVSWMGGSAPTLQSSGVNVIELWKVGSTTYGLLVGKS